MILRTLKNDQDELVLLAVHDPSGNAANILSKTIRFLADQAEYFHTGKPPNDLLKRYFGEPQHAIPVPELQNDGG